MLIGIVVGVRWVFKLRNGRLGEEIRIYVFVVDNESGWYLLAPKKGPGWYLEFFFKFLSSLVKAF